MAVHPNEFKVDHGLGYVDAFALELTMDNHDHLLLNVDYGFQPAADLARVEFLSAK
jgi:hypothetical protein